MIALPVLASFALTLLANADAAPLDKIVAVVGESPIFQSELRHRAKPHLFRIAIATGNDPKKKATETAEMYRQLLDRMIEERVEEREADRAHITVTSEEVDNGINQISTQSKLSKTDLMNEAKRQGLTEQDYKDEIRRQVLEGKLIQLRVRGRVKVTDGDVKKTYDDYIKTFSGPDAPIDLRIIVLRVGSGADAKKTAETRAGQIVQQAKGGTDFCTLVTQHSQDDTTKSKCGSHGPVPRSSLFPDIAKVGSALKPKETAAPLLFKDPSGNEAYLIIQRGADVPTPKFEAVKDQMKEKAYMEAVERERKQWLVEIKKGVYVDVRL